MNYERLLEAIKQQMQPEGRAQHVAGSFQPLLASLPGDVTLADLGLGWQLLALPHSEQEPAAVTHRREVCAQLAAITARLTSEAGQLTGAVKAWQTWQEACQKSADSRLAGMTKTFARELTELQSAE